MLSLLLKEFEHFKEVAVTLIIPFLKLGNETQALQSWSLEETAQITGSILVKDSVWLSETVLGGSVEKAEHSPASVTFLV